AGLGPSRSPVGSRERVLAMSVIACHMRRSIAAYLFKPVGCLRKSCLATFDRSTIYVGDQYRRLLLRSAKSVAARFQREHQWSDATVLSQGNRLVGALESLF